MSDSYYGRPILKEPVWKAEIPWYLFLGGIAGASASLGLAARLAGNDSLAASASHVDAVAISVSPLLLVSDLGRPERFLNMLRVFKVTSPMSVGTWIVSASGAASGVASGCELLGRLPRLRLAAETVAGVLGPFLSTYTAALVADTAIPVWHEARRTLPLVFAGSSAASAGAASAMLAPAEDAAPARRLAVLGAALELGATQVMESRLGSLAEPYHEGEAGRYGRIAKGLTAAGGALMATAGRSRARTAAAGALLLGGSLATRWSVFKAGFQSARDPKYTVEPQRERLAAREAN